MEICPVCNRRLRFNMTYANGQPCIFYDCPCGYSTASDISYSTATTGSSGSFTINYGENTKQQPILFDLDKTTKHH